MTASAMTFVALTRSSIAAPFVGLMRQIEDAGPYATQLRTPPMRVDVLVIVGARAGDEPAAPAEHLLQSAFERGDHRRVVRRAHGMHDHQIPQLISKSGDVGRGALEQRDDLRACVASKPSSIRNRRSNTARQRSATHGVWMPSTAWPPSMPLMFSVADARRPGTTGIAVDARGKRGSRSRRMRSSTMPMCSMASTP